MTRPHAAALLLAGLLAGCSASDDVEQADEPMVAPVRTQIVTTQAFPETVEATGVVASLPEGTHVVAPLYGGTVARLLTVVGAQVTAGQPLCEVALDPVSVAEVERLQRALSLATRALDRQRSAFAAGVTARVALEQAEADAANASAELTGRTRDYDAATHRLTLRAPVAGLVTALDGRAGQHVDAATPVATIIEPGALAATVGIDGGALARVSRGQSATILPAGAGAPPIVTTVARVSPALDAATQRGEAWLTLPAGSLPPGTFVRALIEVAVATHPAVPRDALVETDEGKLVFTVRDGLAVAHAVTLGPTSGDLVAVRTGLDGGETIVTGGAHELTDGMAVKVRDGTPDS